MSSETGPEDDRPSKRIVEQRIRNHVIDYLDLAGSFERQREYQQNVPLPYVPGEVIDMWQDGIPYEPRDLIETWTVYPADEIAAILAFHSVWDSAADTIPSGYPRLEVVQAVPRVGPPTAGGTLCEQGVRTTRDTARGL